MSHTQDIANQDSLFQFDLDDTSITLADLSESHHAFTPEELEEEENNIRDNVGKGKGVTKPMPIRPSTIINDLFDLSQATTSYSSDTSSFSFSSPSSNDNYWNNLASTSTSQMSSLNSSPTSPLYDGLLGKGKEKESPPELPPLSFGTELNSQDTWFSLETPGPSTYITTYSPPHRDDRLPEASSSATPSSVATLPCIAPNTSSPDLTRLPSRCRSLSSLSVQSHASSSTNSTKFKSKFALPRTPSNFTPKLLFGKRDDLDDLSPPITIDVEPCAWYTVPNPISLPSHAITADGTNRSSSPSRTSFLKGKGRSNSSPHPFSALDFVPATRTDIFEPIPIIIRNYFDEVLPRELQLQILQSLVELHALEHQLAVRDGRWTMAKASSSKGRWVGRDKGIRELFKLSRVYLIPPTLSYRRSDSVGARRFRNLGKPLFLTVRCGLTFIFILSQGYQSYR